MRGAAGTTTSGRSLDQVISVALLWPPVIQRVPSPPRWLVGSFILYNDCAGGSWAVSDIPWVGLVLGLIVGGAATVLLWPVECLWLPSQPPQGPFCTSAIGVRSTWWFALATGTVLGIAAGWLALRVARRNDG